VQRDAVCTIRNLMLSENCRDKLSTTGVVPPLIQLLTSDQAEVQEHAAGAVKNQVANASRRGEVTAAGAIPPLVALLRSPVAAVQAETAGALRSLGLDAAAKVVMATSDCPPALVHLLGSDSTVLVQEHAAGAMWAMAHRSEENCGSSIASGAIPPLLQLLKSDAEAVQQQAGGALCALNEPLPPWFLQQLE
jgi:vacuolar protein 8